MKTQKIKNIPIELIIGNKVRCKVPPTNTFEIVITGMSGDGDHDEHNSDFGDYYQVVKWIEILNSVYAMGWNARCGDDNAIRREIYKKAEELGEAPNKLWNWYTDMVGQDITSEDNYAMLTGVEVFWYDEDGEKFEVEAKGLLSST